MVPPRYNGEPFPYPQLRIWIGAAVASMAPVGVGEASLRAVDALLGLATILLLQIAGARLLGWRAATLAALLLPTLPNLMFVHGLRWCGLDAGVIFLTSAGMLCYGVRRVGSLERSSPPRGLDRREATTVVAAGLLFGAACWAKFPVPGLGIVALVVWEIAVARGREKWRGFAIAVATGVVALLVYLPSPWLLWTELGSGYSAFLRWHLLERASGRVSAGSPSPFYYLDRLVADFGPALLLALAGAVAGLRRLRTGDRRSRALAFAAIWALVVLAFYQAVPARNVWYLYPAYPALALLFGGAVTEIVERLRSRSAWLAALAALLVGAYLLSGLATAWAQVRAPAGKSVPQRIADFLVAAGRPTLCQAAGSPLAAWDHYYLGPLATKFGVDPRELDGCELLLTGDPWSVLAPGEEALRMRWLPTFDLEGPPIALVGLRDPLPPEVLALEDRSERALWGRVLLIGNRSEGELVPSRYWLAREHWPHAEAAVESGGPPSPGAEIWHRLDEPFPAARAPFVDAWLPGGQEAALLVAGLDASPLRLLLEPAPTAADRPQRLRIATPSGRVRFYVIADAGPVAIEVAPAAGDLVGDAGAGEGRLALALWSDPWTPRWDVPGSHDPRHLGVRLLALRQGDREIWRLPGVAPEAAGRALIEEGLTIR